MKKKIAVIPGDGTGKEVTREATKVLETLTDLNLIQFEITTFQYGADHYLETGIGLPDEAVEEFRKNYDAILMGSLGDSRIPNMAHAREIILKLRNKLDLYINERWIKVLDPELYPLNYGNPEKVDFHIFRESTEGAFVAAGGATYEHTEKEIAVQEMLYTRKGVERIIRYAFEYAVDHGMQKVTMADKSNVLRFTDGLWLRVFREVSEEFEEQVTSSHVYIDHLAYELLKRPQEFQVIVTTNLFGDILSEIGAVLQGGLGLAASGNYNPGEIGVFKSIHGSAQNIAGKNIVNPFGAILSIQLMLEFFGKPKLGLLIEDAVKQCLRNGLVTRDLDGSLGTQEVGDSLCQILENLYKNHSR
ncbi:MAG: isocitrate/isopropylmalate dehydrogenase family protein [Candidatus Marinimicrobia bacterium]|nr:isocitrate/isopropylmalate dehydrogenase family protein [Candidatus Neomarinimicrobiota bacterium]MCF7828159.1 isocitrate/isopropylmalate dehydrogenase family protein [Candidatus Neomarinimicrobiota bacterium]MCF7879666.1 isocitrate/isopropylmalate dehydrogenase family protein [Candidatus Neomarinimicrobiota bacterium]